VTEGQGRSLGVDLGDARIGLALSDLLGLTAQPQAALKAIGPRRDAQRIAAFVEEHDVHTVVVGLPLLLSGEDGERSAAARAFAARLERRFTRVRVTLWDERMTTVEAERALIAGNVRRRRRREAVDSLAAALILQRFLDAGSPPSPPAWD
jgi:putative Holliday junction resolvase